MVTAPTAAWWELVCDPYGRVRGVSGAGAINPPTYTPDKTVVALKLGGNRR